MKRFHAAAIAAAILCLLPVYAPGQSSDITPASPTAGATLDLVGPAGSIQPGEDAELRLAGLTLDELQAAQDRGNFDLTAWPLAGLRLRSYYDWMDRTLKLDFRARDPGEYLVKLHLVRAGAQEIAAVVVTVDGKQEPPPNPPVPPVPPGPRHLVVIEETAHRSMAIAEALKSRPLTEYLKANRHTLYLTDQHGRNEAGVAPAAYAPYLERAKGKTLPILFIVGGSDAEVLFEAAPPATPDGWIDLLGTLGG